MKFKYQDILFELFRTAMAILIAFAAAFVILIFISKTPGRAVASFFLGPFQNFTRMANIIELAIPYVFAGLGMCFMYTVDRFNMSAEGIFLASGCFGVLIAFGIERLPVGHIGSLALVIGGGTALGGLIAFVPAFLREKFQINEVVVSIMINYILLYGVRYILRMKMKDHSLSYNASYEIPHKALLQNLIPQTRIHTGLLIAAAVLAAGAWFLLKTSAGYRIRMIGKSPAFARYCGMNVFMLPLAAQVLGGMVAGMGGTVEVLGMYERFQWEEFTQYGFDGILIAVLAGKNPVYVPLAALFLAYFRTGADIVGRTSDVSYEFAIIIQAMLILLVAAKHFMDRARNKSKLCQAILTLAGKLPGGGEGR